MVGNEDKLALLVLLIAVTTINGQPLLNDATDNHNSDCEKVSISSEVIIVMTLI